MAWDKIRLHFPTTLELAALIKSQPECLPFLRNWMGITEQSDWEVNFHEERQFAEQDPLVTSGRGVGREMCVLMVEISVNDLRKLQESCLAARFTIGLTPARRVVKVYPGGIARLAQLLSVSRQSHRATVDYFLVPPPAAQLLSASVN